MAFWWRRVTRFSVENANFSGGMALKLRKYGFKAKRKSKTPKDAKLRLFTSKLGIQNGYIQFSKTLVYHPPNSKFRFLGINADN